MMELSSRTRSHALDPRAGAPDLRAWALPLLLLLTAACAPTQASPPAAADRPAPAPPPAAAGAEEILRAVEGSNSRAVLVNVWATWCVPCREEFPDLMRLRKEYGPRGFDLVLVSADFDTPVEEVRGFLTEQGVDFPTYIKTGGDAPFIDALDPEWSGALPASFLYDRAGARRASWEGRVSYRQLEERISRLLN